MWRDAVLVAGKDLRIELRSKVARNQLAPFAVLVLVLFAFALDPDRGVLVRASAGLFWLAVVFSMLLAVQRSFSVETADRASDSMRLAALDPAGIFLGKAAALAAELVAIEMLLGAGVVVLFGTEIAGLPLLLLAAGFATVGLAAAGAVYGALSSGLRARETLLPLLLVPVVAPVILAATRASETALDGAAADGWSWVRLLAVLAAVYLAAGIAAFGTLFEETG